MNFLRGIVIFSALKSIFCVTDWNYLEKGPDFWFQVSNSQACRSGQMQSPINIIPSTTFYDSKLTDITFNGYSSIPSWDTKYDGHSISSTQSNTALTKPFITGSNYGKQFNLLQFHFHWGQNDFQGSEHVMDSQKFPLELHLVHRADDGQLAVIGFFFQISAADNPALNGLVNGVQAALQAAENAAATQITFDLGAILPDANSLRNSGYFRYSGSLTTPPCSEGVIWTVYNTQLSISTTQLAKFRSKATLQTTFRDAQRISNRLVYSSIRYNTLKSLGCSLKLDKIYSFYLLLFILSFFL